ncbi:MAG: mechanosensitive ion channel family protein [Clostridiales bacterium]|nr:mechanosensitive ion channel family protein [Clostridiales bacterium]
MSLSVFGRAAATDTVVDSAVDTLTELVGEDATQSLIEGAKNVWSFISQPAVGAVATIIICIIVAKILLKITDKTAEKMKLEPTAIKFWRSATRVVIWALVILVGAGTLGFDVTSLVAVVSVVGAALALAAQDYLANVFGGVMLVMTKPFLVDEYICVGDTEGTVLEIGLLNTKLRTLDRRVVIIPNNSIFSGTIINCSRAGMRRIDLNYSISYGADITEVREVMMKVLNDCPMVLHEPEEPFARITGFGESAVIYTERYWCKPGDYWPSQYELMENTKRALDAAGIVIPFNQIVVHKSAGS